MINLSPGTVIYLFGVSVIAASAIRSLPADKKKGYYIAVAALIAATIASNWFYR